MNTLNLIYISPEIFLLVISILSLFISIFFFKKKNIIYFVSIITLFVCSILTIYNLLDKNIIYLFNNMFIQDKLSNILKLFLYFINIIIIIYNYQYYKYQHKLSILYSSKEFYFLILFSILGQMIIISSNNLLSTYLGIELTSLTICSLIILSTKNIKSSEASIKYFILSAIASGFMLYGISMIYGSTNSIELNIIFYKIVSKSFNYLILLLGITFLLIGLFFKIGVSPFHFWIPDVYQGSSLPITMLISCTPKISVLAVILRLIYNLFPIFIYFQKIFFFISVLSIIIGSMSAIMQSNIKRMLAYSSIFHMGFILLGIGATLINKNINQHINSYIYSLFYTIMYIIININILGLSIIFSNKKYEAQNIKDFNGLNIKNQLFSIILLISILSLSGIPPLIGFYTKLSILKILLQTNNKFISLIVTLFSFISVFYSLKIIKNVFFKNPINSLIKSNFCIKILLILNIIIIIISSIYPDYIINICAYAINKTFIYIH